MFSSNLVLSTSIKNKCIKLASVFNKYIALDSEINKSFVSGEINNVEIKKALNSYIILESEWKRCLK